MCEPLPPRLAAIVARLSQGPLPCTSYQGLASSSASLKVQVRNLRKLGFRIRTERGPEAGRKRGRPPGEYRLIEKDRCNA